MKLFTAATLLLAAVPCHASGFLHARGQDIVDEQGHRVMLRGVGLGNWMLPEGYMWHFGGSADRPRRIEKVVSDLIGPEEAAKFWPEYRKNYVTDADIARIAEMGFNSVRPALDARLFLTEGDSPQEVKEGFDLLDNLVASCARHNIYVIIDMHAAPGGQTGQNIDDSADDQPGLFMEKEQQDRLIGLWVKIARRYADQPAVAAYDLLNEPLPQRTGAEAKYKADLQPLYARITAAIREVDPRHMVTVEGSDWANDWTAFTPPAFTSNVVYQFHYYCWDNPVKLKGIGHYLDFRDKVNAPVWVGETGEANDAIYWGTTEYFESRNVGWSFWPWKKMDSRNGICSIRSPAHWDEITAFTRGEGKPSPEVARQAFSELLNNVKIENCRISDDVVNSLFHRAPVRVEAENYGQEGLNKSYFVEDSRARATQYRTSEPVPVESVEGGGSGRNHNGQAIQLKAGEWTDYELNSVDSASFRIQMRARNENSGGSSAISVGVNDSSKNVEISVKEWTEVDIPAAELRRGENHVRLSVKSGAAGIDWLNFQSSTSGSK